MADAFPSWSGPSFGVLLAVIELCLIVAILLLALPMSHPWFRKSRGVDEGNVKLLLEAGADVLVAGTSVFGGGDPAASARRLLEAAR